MTTLQARAGTALIAAIVVLFILECVVLGTLHLALLETRIADNVAAALRLRLAAASVAHATLAAWPAAADSLEPHTHVAIPAPRSADGLDVAVTVERLAPSLFLITAVSRQPAPRHGRASAGLLAMPPALPPGFTPAPAALSASEPPVIGADGRVSGTPVSGECVERGPAMLLPLNAPLTPDVYGAADGGIGILDDADAPAVIVARIAAALRASADSAVLFVDGDYQLPQTFDGIAVVTGDVHIAAGSRFRGLLFAGGTLLLDADATFSGAAHVAGLARIDGVLTFDPCIALDALATTRLARARTVSGRSSIPTF